MAAANPPGAGVVAALRRDDDVVDVRAERGGEDRFTGAVVAVDGRGVEERDAGVERGVHERIGVVDLTPPLRRQRPRPEPDLRDDELRIPEPTKPHDTRSTRTRSRNGRPR